MLRFNGGLAPFTEHYESEGQLSLIFRSPFARLMGYGPGSGPQWTSTFSTAFAEQVDFITSVFTLAVIRAGPVPILAGTLTPTGIGRTVARVQGTPFGQTIIDVANLANGYEFLDRPVNSGATQGLLDAGPTMGTDKPGVRFEYGEDTLRNVQAFGRSVGLPVNRAYIVYAGGNVGAADDATSIAKYGVLPTVEFRTELSDGALAVARAQALLRPNPPRIVSFSPDPALGPSPLMIITSATLCGSSLDVARSTNPQAFA